MRKHTIFQVNNLIKRTNQMRYSLFSLLLTVIISLSLTKCGVQQAQTHTPMHTDNYNYEQAWNEVDSLDRKQLPKSARAIRRPSAVPMHPD